MSEKAKTIFQVLSSFSGVFNVYQKSDIELKNADDIDFLIEKGLSITDKNQDKINLSKDYSKVKKDISKSWKKKETIY